MDELGKKLLGIMRDADAAREFFAVLPSPTMSSEYDVFVVKAPIFHEFWRWFEMYTPNERPAPCMRIRLEDGSGLSDD